MTIESDKVTQTMRHEDETNAFVLHLLDVALEAAEIYQTLENDTLCEEVHVDPVDSGTEFLHHSLRGVVDNVVDCSLLLSKLTIHRERNSNIRAVMMQRVPLISQHHLPINQRLIIVLVVESGSSRSAPTDRNVRGHSACEVFLLTMEVEEGL